jgi:hypothetical protein
MHQIVVDAMTMPEDVRKVFVAAIQGEL